MRSIPDKVVKKIRTHFMWSIHHFRKSCALYENVEKYGRAGQAVHYNIRGSYRKSWATIFCKVTCFIIDKTITPPQSKLSLFFHIIATSFYTFLPAFWKLEKSPAVELRSSHPKTLTHCFLNCLHFPIFKMFHPSSNTARNHAHTSISTLKSLVNFCSRDFLFLKEFDDSTLAKRHIVVGHFVRSNTSHVMQAIDVTGHSRITQQLVPSTTALSFVCCSQFARKKKSCSWLSVRPSYMF